MEGKEKKGGAKRRLGKILQKIFFINRPYFTVLFGDKLYRCETILKCMIITKCGKEWSMVLIWENCCGSTQRCALYLHGDGVTRVENEIQITSMTYCIYTYLSGYYGSCYAKNKSKIYKKIFSHSIYIDDSMLRFIIYLHLYKTKFSCKCCVDMVTPLLIGDVYDNTVVWVK